MHFYLGTHRQRWLADLDVPLCVSRVHFYGAAGNLKRDPPRARVPWFLDSGAFSELARASCWELPMSRFVDQVREIMAEVGNVAHVGPQDWMCEPSMIERTGLTVPDHQHRTVANYVALVEAAPEVPWVPVVQGWDPHDYWRCADLYTTAGVDLAAAPLVALGSVCRRQDTRPVAALISGLARDGLRLHGLGMKVSGLTRCGWALTSADSLAWSLDGRLPNGSRCSPHRDHKQCANCKEHALAWRSRLLNRVASQQPELWWPP